MATMINDPVVGSVVQSVLDEVEKSRKKHPGYPDSHLRRAAITIEELTEAIVEMAGHAAAIQRKALQVERVGTEQQYATIDDLRKELIHTAAMCFKHLEAIELERSK